MAAEHPAPLFAGGRQRGAVPRLTTAPPTSANIRRPIRQKADSAPARYEAGHRDARLPRGLRDAADAPFERQRYDDRREDRPSRRPARFAPNSHPGG